MPETDIAVQDLRIRHDRLVKRQRIGMDQVDLRLFGRDRIRRDLQAIGSHQAVHRGKRYVLCGNDSRICAGNAILSLCKSTDRQQ